LATLAEFVTEQNIESVLIESIVKSLDAAHVEARCGKKHATGDGIFEQMLSRTSINRRVREYDHTVFTDEKRDHQLDLVHVGRTLDYNLRDDDVFSLDQRSEIVSEVIGEVFHLKNSVAKHRQEEEFAAVRARIARTTGRMEKTAWQLDQFGSKKAAGYLRRWLPSIVTFAERAIEGFQVPWTSNPVERLMGEVSKRCKNQWMHWSKAGLEAILDLRLVKYMSPDHYREFCEDLLNRSTNTTMSCDLTVEATRGRL
ncbi:hypothetical protein BRC60_10740, partial [Halobacteriales archaeon QH_1_68_42]